MAIIKTRVTIVGAGMSGPLLAIYLAQRGFRVDVYERRGDPRLAPMETGKSIKLTLAERGFHALRKVGLEEEVKTKCCIPLRGRAIHTGNGPVTFIPYGKNDREVIYSISRRDLNTVLLDHAEAWPNVHLHFHRRCVEIDKESAAAVFFDDRGGGTERVAADILIGADGAFSTVRQQVQRGERADYRQDFLAWGYKELSIVATPDGRHQMDKHALHIWPCGDHMLFALPNRDGSFNGVCTLPLEGEHSFSSIHNDEDVLTLFRTYFADALPFMPNLLTEFSARRVSEFVTIRTSRWHHRGTVVLVGDAVHTVVPFYGQGMNSAFEDCFILDECIHRHPAGDWEAVFTEYQALRKPHTDVLAELSMSNFHELRDTVRRPIVAARKRTAILLNRLLGQRSLPLYSMISHSNLPYADCVERARRQDRLGRWLGLDLMVWAVALAVYLRAAWVRRRTHQQRDDAQQSIGPEQLSGAEPDQAGG